MRLHGVDAVHEVWIHRVVKGKDVAVALQEGPAGGWDVHGISMEFNGRFMGF